MSRWHIPSLTPLHKTLLAVAAGVLLLAATLVPVESSPVPAQTVLLHQAPEVNPSPANQTRTAPEQEHAASSSGGEKVEWTVQPGDTLIHIFHSSNAPVSDLQEIMKADEEYLSLETLKPGAKLGLTFDSSGRFSALTLYIDPARRVVYSRQEDGSFVHDKFEADTTWVSEVLRGSVDGSFYTSALHSGLSRAQVLVIDQLLGNRINFRKDLRAGDEFTVIVGHEMATHQTTGNTRIEAIAFTRGSRTHYAFRFEDGNYYDQDGESVTPAFLRWPTRRHYRISSPFNPRRLHPVTGRISPHNGVDLATPVGTPILSTGDGVVRRIGNHPYAGRYVDIEHAGGSYTTRYLHLSKVLVSRGAVIKRGQKIALSGNTGRTTGPHLHFEFHIKGHPVDPMTAKIPTSATIPAAKMAQFHNQLQEQLAIMKYAGSRSDMLLANLPASFE